MVLGIPNECRKILHAFNNYSEDDPSRRSAEQQATICKDRIWWEKDSSLWSSFRLWSSHYYNFFKKSLHNGFFFFFGVNIPELVEIWMKTHCFCFWPYGQDNKLETKYQCIKIQTWEIQTNVFGINTNLLRRLGPYFLSLGLFPFSLSSACCSHLRAAKNLLTPLCCWVTGDEPFSSSPLPPPTVWSRREQLLCTSPQHCV